MKQTQSTLGTWRFEFSQGGLAPSEEIQAIAEQDDLFRAPTIIFSKSYCVITESKSGLKLTFNAREALKFINYKARAELYVAPDAEPKINTISYIPERLFVKHAEHWKNIQKPKDIEITEIKQSSDSFFLTTFKGLVEGNVKVQRVKQNVIPVDKLGPTNPITFYQQGSLYEDELDDNGLIQYEYKFRTMAASWFGLVRNYARIDDVTVIIYDTRLYWQQGWTKFGRQFMVKKATWQQLKDKQFDFTLGWNMNPNQSHLIYPFLNQEFIQNEYIHFA